MKTSHWRGWLPFLAFVPILGALNIFTMPALPLAGDSAAIRLIATHLAQSGEFGIPYAEKPNLPESLLKIRGQFFIPNDDRERLYSRWGETNTLFLAGLEWIRGAQGWSIADDYVPYQNAFNIFFTLLFAFYVILMAAGFGAPIWSTGLYLAGVIYGSFLWAYLRVPSYEIYQLALFQGFSFHFLKYLKFKESRHFWISQVLLLALVHVKFFFVVLYLPAALMIFRLKRKEAKAIIPWFAASLILAVVSNWALIAYKTGILSFAFDAPLADNWDPQWGLQYFWMHVVGYAVGAKDSLFLHFPLLLPSLLLWPKFWKSHKSESIFFLSAFGVCLLPLLFHASHGEWCLGPRYLLFILPALCLPILVSLPRIKKAVARRISTASVAALIFISAFFQWQLISLPFYSRHWMIAFVTETKPEMPNLRDHFDRRTDYFVFWELKRFFSGGQTFAPVEMMLPAVPEQREPARVNIRNVLGARIICNFYFRILCP